MKKMTEVKSLRIGKETLLRLGSRPINQVAGGATLTSPCVCTTQFVHIVRTNLIHI
ncbi:MAG TPA: hypothetical protein VKY89_03885 [Thermoanaerobaculia bacterium]|jgi:hypothetical protein|nr:hypothetical protein [Thermoanaerobaculia bacterium]